jgi:hypothetical protein
MNPVALRPCAILLAAAALVIHAAPASAQDDDFRRGMAARRDKKWAEDAAAMRSAIAMDSKESTRTVRRRVAGVSVFGTGDEYLPHFFLGEALFNLDDCPGALNAWDESDRQGVARKVGTSARTIQDGSAKCESQGFLPSPKYGEELRAARTAHTTATQVLGALAKELEAHPGAKIDTAAQATARGQVATAGERLASGEKTRRAQELTDARTMSEAAVRQLQVLRGVIARFVEDSAVISARIKGVEDQLQVADNAARDLDASFASSPLPIGPGDSLNADRARAVQLLTSARDRLRNASRTSSDVEVAEASKAVAEALAALGKVKTAFEGRVGKAVSDELSRLQATGSAGFVRVGDRVRTLRDSLTKQPDVAVSAELDKVEASVNRSRRTLDGAVKGRDLRSARNAAGAVTQFELQLEDLARRLGINQPLVVPPALLAAAQAQFQGRYAEVLSAMTVDGIDQVPIALRIHAHLIRAAALFAMYELSGPRDETFRSRARDEADRARQLDAAFQPNAAAFSPRFIRFYQAAAAAPPQ